VFAESVINRKLPGKPVLVRQPERGEAFSDCTQAQPFGRDVLLPFNISRTDNQGQAMQSRCAQLVVFNNGFERATSSR